MRIAVRRFEDRDAAAVDRLNLRLAAADTWHRVYKEDLSENPEADLGVRPINDALYVAADGDEIRGGAWLREQHFWADGAQHRVGWMKYPVAESVIDPQYAGVPASMVIQFLRQQPRLLALGMGGHQAPFARLLAGIGWKSFTIPFFFSVVRPFRVLRGLAYARRRWLTRMAMDAAAFSGAGWAAFRAARLGAHRLTRASGVRVHVESRFTPWADATWVACRTAYPVLAFRDAKALDHLYPPSFPGLSRLRVTRAGADIGWACTQILPANRNNTSYFGRLKVGLVTDVLSHPDDATDVLAAAVEHLESEGVDLAIVYFTHEVWIEAARRLRFRRGPSNFAFYMSREAEGLFVADGDLQARCHFMRHTFGEDALIEEPPDEAAER